MLKARNLKFQYSDHDKIIFSDLNFTIQVGEIVALLGPSGSGKSTLAHLLAGYLLAQEGEIIFQGKKNSGPGRDRIIISQENDLFPFHTVIKHLNLVSSDQAKNQQWLKLVGLENYQDKYPHELSGGMKKRLSFARALAAESPFIIMDEPFSSLDQELKETLYQDLLKIVREKNITILLITHDQAEAEKLAGRVLYLDESGRIKDYQ